MHVALSLHGGAGTSASRGAGRQNARRESGREQAQWSERESAEAPGSGLGNGQGSRQERSRTEAPRTAAWVQKAFETAQTIGPPTGELNDGWDEWSSLAGSTPDSPIVDGGGAARSSVESNGSMQSTQTPAAAAPSSQEALLGTDVDIITGQRYSAAQVTHCW